MDKIKKEMEEFRKDETVKKCREFIDGEHAEDKIRLAENGLWCLCRVKYPNLFSA